MQRKKYTIRFIAKIILFSLALTLLTACSSSVTSDNSTNSAGVSSSSELEVYYLSVGQADAAVLECDGHYAMIDCGNDSIQEDGVNSLKIDLFLEQEGITEFDYIFCSHYDDDHFDGFADILDGRTVKKVYGPSGSDKDNHAMNTFRNAIKEQGKSIKTPKIGDSFSLGGAQIDVLAVDSDGGKSTNDSSLVLMVSYGETKFLFAGDGERKTESYLIDSGTDISCDVLKVAHHGSSTSSSDEFLHAVKPTYAILSVAPDRKLPDSTVIDGLTRAGATVFRTDEEGTICCKSDGKKIQITNNAGEALN